jgi:predicted alpha/beta-fold hydrolase
VTPFVPLIRNPHWQTIAGNFWPRDAMDPRCPVERRLFRTEPGVQVLVQSQKPVGEAKGGIIMIHGLEGSGDAGYMRSLAGAALRAGFAAHRFHLRSCGGTQDLCETLYHGGLTSDLLAVLREMVVREGAPPLFLVGFSLGGNVALKLAGELGEAAAELIRGVCAVSTPLDLAACARRISQLDNRLYERRFVHRMRLRLLATGRYTKTDLAKFHSVIDIDDQITAPSFGFGNAENYYRTQSSMGFLDAIRLPALLIQSKDDTFIPWEIFQQAAVSANPQIELLATEYGGHVGFIGKSPHRFWADETIMEWITRQCAKEPAGESSKSERPGEGLLPG